MITYDKALEKIMAIPMFQNVGASAFIPTLDNIIKLTSLFNNPHTTYKTIHVAGTNGKGSTSSMLNSILMEAGFKVGLYTSPHLSDYRERIRINGEMVCEQTVCEFMDILGDKIDEWKPSFFEVTTALAFYSFRRENVDFAIIEVGLGGLTDSTNIISPELSIITNISIDHKNILGSTLTEIATQKGGIIKKGTPIIVGQHNIDSDTVFNAIAKEKGSELIYAEDVFSVTKTDDLNKNISVKNGDNEKVYHLDLGGDYQHKNIITALTAVDILRSQGVCIDENAVNKGLSNVVINSALYGRWQIISSKPLTVCDTGHNHDGLTYVSEQLKRSKYNKLYIVIGFMADKDVDSILPLLPQNAYYFFATASNPRSMSCEDLLSKAKSFNLKGEAAGYVAQAYAKAKAKACDDDMIFIGGSTFIVADLLESQKASQ